MLQLHTVIKYYNKYSNTNASHTNNTSTTTKNNNKNTTTTTSTTTNLIIAEIKLILIQ